MLRREAANWLARLQSGRDPDAEHRFRRWYEAHPSHAAAFDSVRRSYEKAGLLRHSPVAGVWTTERPSIPEPRSPRYAWAAAAALVVAIPASLLLIQRGFVPGRTNATMLVTGVGEIRSVALEDGSRITLDTATRVEVEINDAQRRARLKDGRARFEVVRAREPFVVEAGDTMVTSSESVFDVEKTGDRRRVHVLSGRADVRGGGGEAAEVTLHSGQGLAAEAISGMERTDVVQGGTEWTRGMLQFDGTPLGEAVELANRYSRQKIVLGADVARLRVTGAFRAGDIAGLAKAFAAAFDLSLGRTPDGNLILSREVLLDRPKKNGG